MKIVIQYIFLLLTLISCKEQTNEPVSSTPYEKWQSYNIHNYTIEQVRSCFCVNGGVKMKVTVQSDTLFSVMKLSDSTFISYPTSTQYLSIDSLFGIIRYSKTDSLIVTYNAQYGYPDKLDINPQQHPVDGGALYETSNLQLIK
jgi:hypothetical protein